MIKIVLAFFILWNPDGSFQQGAVIDGGWKTVAECREEGEHAVARNAANGVISQVGCFEITPPPNKKAP